MAMETKEKHVSDFAQDVLAATERLLQREDAETSYTKRVGKMADSFYYIEEGVNWMNRPNEVHSFTPEKVRQEAIELIAKTMMLVDMIDIDQEISKSTANT